MNKLSKIHLACVTLMAIFCASYASAFDASMYATTSKLATGKWVKISIPENGMYQVTYDELRAMGFNNPAQVKVYGRGGNPISEVLNGTAVDDLKPVPMLRYNDKICFYGAGPIAMTVADFTTTPHFVRAFNPYSQVGCYFLTEDGNADLKPTMKVKVTVNNYVNQPNSLSYFYHEREMATASSSGKEMLGEDFATGKIFVDYFMPGLADSTIVVQTAIAASASEITYANGIVHNGNAADTTAYSVSQSRIYRPSGDFVYYNFATPYGELKLSEPAERGQFEPYLKFTSEDGEATLLRLDYFILTYKRVNVIEEGEDNQIMMGYGVTRGNERFQLPNATPSTVVWNINNVNAPQEVTTNQYNDESGTGLYFFSTSATNSKYIAFDPAKDLKSISSFEPVANQNLHAMPVPDMLIITDKIFHEQAQRIADMHAMIDGIDVAVVDQDQIFNEFSSGTRDGMAYRLLCKMLYDRDPVKFKYLLLFGTGSYDNRELLGTHDGNLLTYQSDNSNYEDFSFTSDDFFGFLEDNSGSNVAGEKLTIGIGRITCGDLEEAKSDVDKLIEYYATPDYGAWRNNTMVISDSPDYGQYMFQGEGYKNMIDNELQTGMHAYTVHNSQYARSTTQPNLAVDHKTATEAKHRLSDLFKEGQYFGTYVGHAGPISFTKVNNMWVTGDVVRTTYPHMPILSTACCDVAHYDNDTRGIAELMFHKRDGGAIALFTSSRMVVADANDIWNQFLITGFFSNAANGKMPTLGDAYRFSKTSFISSDINKMSFFLLGDPAMKVNYPLTLFNITEVNSTDMTDTTAVAQIRPLMQFEVKAQVVDAEGNLDTSFNGDATVTLYDNQMYFTTLSFKVSGVMTERDIFLPREKLTEVSGRVVNGLFTGSVIVPKAPSAKNENVLLRVYAHKDNTDRMVNGFTKNIMMLPYDENAAISDNQAPVISSMFINDEMNFTEGSVVNSSAMLYITATDDMGISVQANTVDNTMTLLLDGGKQSYSDITAYTTTHDGGKQITINFPLENMAEGLHTLTYTVYDMVGNSDTKTITFMVGQNGQVDLVADKLPALLDGEVNFDLDTDLARTPEVIVRVTDATGKLMWMTTSHNFPVTWDMKDMNGNKVPAGLYRYFGTYNDGANYGGTPINKLIVLDPVKTAGE